MLSGWLQFVLLFFYSFDPGASAFRKLDNSRADNVEAIGKAYGYLRFFCPVPDYSEAKWDRLLYQAIDSGINCKNAVDLAALLTKTFGKADPDISFIVNKEDMIAKNYPSGSADSSTYERCLYWQHIGNGNSFADIYHSVIVNRNKQVQLYAEPIPGDLFVVKRLNNDLYVRYPRIICTRDSVLKRSVAHEESTSGPSLPENLDYTDVRLRFFSLIKIWTVFEHFFPYWDDVHVRRDSLLYSTIIKCERDRNEDDFLQTLQLMTAALNDGHIQISSTNSFSKLSYSAGISVDWVENNIVVTDFYTGDSTNLKRGDIVVKIDNLDDAELLKRERYLSGSAQYKRYLLMKDLLAGPKGSFVTLQVKDQHSGKIKMVRLERKLARYDPATGREWVHNFSRRKTGAVGESAFYLDLRNIREDSLQSLIPALNNFSNVICDLRGYPPLYAITLLNHLLKVPDTSSHWLQTPLISNPDYENVQYRYTGYRNLTIQNPRIKSRFFFLSNSASISFTEVLLAIIRQNKLGTIIGSPSAGTNGNINLIELPLGFYCYYTGMRVVNPDGSKHHLIGVLPDITVTPDIKSIREGKDRLFEEALRLSSRNF